MISFKKTKSSITKERSIQDFSTHVSSGKSDFFQRYGMDFVMGKRKGPFLYDLDGQKKLYNLHCNGGVFNLGHRNEEIIEALKGGLVDLDIGNHHLISSWRSALAKKISELMPEDLGYSIFGVSGGEAVDLSIKIARAYTGKSRILSIHGGYHGHTGLSMAAGDPKYRDQFGPVSPGFQQLPFNQMDVWENSFSDDVAAVILETIPATLGITIPSLQFIQGVRKLCDQHGALLILDEVQSGLGRTGKLWAFEHFDVVPDIVVIGKGLSGGIYPITATVIRNKLEKVFHKDPFVHISTFGGSELGCIVAQKVLEISSQQDFLHRVSALGEQFKKRLADLKVKFPGTILEIRQLGLMIGIKMSSDLAGPVLTKVAYDRGLLMIYANNDPSVCQMLPPLITPDTDMDYIFERLEKAISRTQKSLPLVRFKKAFQRILK